MTEHNQSPNAPEHTVPKHLLGPDSPLPANVQHLLRAVAGHTDPTLPCPECEALLPTYVAAEVDGLDVATLYPEVKHHLDLCDECVERYLDMLELALAEVNGEFVTAATPPPPDLSFLPPLKVTLSEYVRSLATQLIDQLAPQQRARLEDIAAPFFARVAASEGRFSLKADFVPALGLGTGEEMGPLELLAATYLATEALTDELASLQEDHPMGAEALAALATQKATTAAEALQLDRQQARAFTQQYTAQVRQDRATLHRLARSLG